MRFEWIGALAVLAGPAEAGLTLCNDGDTRAKVAIAYAQDGIWMSEGWWGIDSGACAVVVAGSLLQRHYYYTRIDDPDFAGEGYSFCTQSEVFLLTGADGDCAGLSAESRPFAHIDTGAEGTDFTHRLAAPPAPKQETEAPRVDTSATEPPASDLSATIAAAAIPSFERGGMGEPFVVDAIFQECWSIEGDEGCLFHAEGARFYLVPDPAGNPAALEVMRQMPMGRALRVSGDMISMGDMSAEVVVAAVEEIDDPYADLRAAMQGDWVSVDDPLSRLRIFGSEHESIYDGQTLGTALLTLSGACDDASAGVLLRLREDGGDPEATSCYEVVEVTDSRMELIYLPRGNLLVYTRP